MMQIIASPSSNFNDRRTQLDMLVLHYTGMKDGASALARMCDPNAQVSAHYMIEEDGRVFQLVDEDKRAWHAGVSSWNGLSDINSHSIGVEIVNGGHDFGLPDFPQVQIESVIDLCQQICGRHSIPSQHIVAHSDIAPGRKLDPGEKFPWQSLGKQGIGIWPAQMAPMLTDGQAEPVETLLRRIGYDVGQFDLADIVFAFQQRWLPEMLSGQICETTHRRIRQIADLYYAVS